MLDIKLNEIDSKLLNKTLSNQIQQHFKRIIYQDQVGFIPGLVQYLQINMMKWKREWVAFPFSRGFSQPRDQTQVSCVAGGFFTGWATREATREDMSI